MQLESRKQVAQVYTMVDRIISSQRREEGGSLIATPSCPLSVRVLEDPGAAAVRSILLGREGGLAKSHERSHNHYNIIIIMRWPNLTLGLGSQARNKAAWSCMVNARWRDSPEHARQKPEH